MGGLLITGASGYVGGRLVERAAPEREVHALWRSNQPPPGGIDHRVDLDDVATLHAVVERARPEVIVHAAYEMAGGAEPNLRWTRNALAAAAHVNARFVFVSTDLVFDGDRGWYRESDQPRPRIAYGIWKAQLEREVLAASGVAARTALVWGLDPPSDSAARLVLEPLQRGETPRLFDDEWRTPTEVHDLADALLQASDAAGPRILHCAGPERLSRLDFGRMLATYFGFPNAHLPPFHRAVVAPDRPADTSLLLDSTRAVISTRFRGPTEVLAAP